ncbi:MAG: hypothetical protein LUC88_11175 [Prevotella sp.]|nr:hypothetical protein [Prevotella sp.]
MTETKVYSKFGRFWDATHSRDVLCETSAGKEDLSYGIPYAYMRRPIAFKFEEKSTKNVSVDEKLKREIRAKLNK